MTFINRTELLNSNIDFLSQKALAIKENHFGHKLYTRGVLEISNHCFLNCHYCGMRKDNNSLPRYRMELKEILFHAHFMEETGVQSIMLQSGDDYHYPIYQLVDAIKTIKAETNLHVILCLGERKKSDLEKMWEAGANMYIMKLETLNPDLFSKLRPNTTFEKRLDLLKFLKNIGYETSSGFISGLPGQTIEELTEGISLLKELEVDNASVSPFIPNKDSPLKDSPPGNMDIALKILALMRIHLGKVNIPAVSAFSILEKDGQLRAFKAGANVLTINFSPERNQKNFLIYDQDRAIINLDRAKELLLKSGLTSNLRLYNFPSKDYRALVSS